MERELDEQVLGRGQAAELPAAGAAPRPQALGVEGEEAGGGDDAAVQLDDPVAAGVAEGPRVVAARHLGESRVAERRDRLRPALEREEVHVRHRAVGLHVVDRLREDRALQRQTPDAARLEEPEDPGGEADLAEGADEVGPPPGGEGLRDRGRPRRAVALDHA